MIFAIILTLSFIVLVAIFLHMYIKRICIIGIFIHFLIEISVKISRLFLALFIVSCFIFSYHGIALCIYVDVLRVSYLFFTDSGDYNASSGSVFFLVHFNIDKDADCLRSNNNTFK